MCWEPGRFCREVMSRQTRLESARRPGTGRRCGPPARGLEQTSARRWRRLGSRARAPGRARPDCGFAPRVPGEPSARLPPAASHPEVRQRRVPPAPPSDALGIQGREPRVTQTPQLRPRLHGTPLSSVHGQPCSRAAEPVSVPRVSVPRAVRPAPPPPHSLLGRLRRRGDSFQGALARAGTWGPSVTSDTATFLGFSSGFSPWDLSGFSSLVSSQLDWASLLPAWPGSDGGLGEMQNPAPIPDLPNLSLHFSKIPKGPEHTRFCNQSWSRVSPLAHHGSPLPWGRRFPTPLGAVGGCYPTPPARPAPRLPGLSRPAPPG